MHAAYKQSIYQCTQEMYLDVQYRAHIGEEILILVDE